MLGQIIDLDLNIVDHSVQKYIVKHKAGFFGKNELLLAPNQIVKITEQEIIVKDLQITEEEKPYFKIKDAVLSEDPAISQSRIEN